MTEALAEMIEATISPGVASHPHVAGGLNPLLPWAASVAVILDIACMSRAPMHRNRYSARQVDHEETWALCKSEAG
jgi:hypothetical protein